MTAWRGSRRGESDLAGLLAGLGESLAARGYRAEFQGGALEVLRGAEPRGACLYLGRAYGPGGGLELSALAAGGRETGALVWLLTVDETADPAAWLRNRRAFTLAVLSLAPREAGAGEAR